MVKKSYYRNGDVPRIPAHSISDGKRSWSNNDKTLIARSSTRNVEFYNKGDIQATLTSAKAYELGRDLYHKQEDKSSDTALWGQMLCSAAEYAAS